MPKVVRLIFYWNLLKPHEECPVQLSGRPGRTRFTLFCRRVNTCTYKFQLTISPGGTNSLWIGPRPSKNMISIVFTLIYSMCEPLDVEVSYSADCLLVSRSYLKTQVSLPVTIFSKKLKTSWERCTHFTLVGSQNFRQFQLVIRFFKQNSNPYFTLWFLVH